MIAHGCIVLTRRCKRTHICMHGEMEPEYCNRTATGEVQSRTGLDSLTNYNAINRSDKRNFLTEQSVVGNPRPNQVKCVSGGRPRRHIGAWVQQRCSNEELTECFCNRVGGLAAHTGEHVGVGVEGDGDGGVP